MGKNVTSMIGRAAFSDAVDMSAMLIDLWEAPGWLETYYSAANCNGASRGTMIWIFVPAPGLVSRLIRPPKRLVTMSFVSLPSPSLRISHRIGSG
jgi:hypothetical protein